MSTDTRKKKSKATQRDKEIGANLRHWRNVRGYNQRDLGNSIEVTFQQVQKYERGANRISASCLENLAKFLHVNVTTLLNIPDETVVRMPKGDLALLGKIAVLSDSQRKAIMFIIDGFTTGEA